MNFLSIPLFDTVKTRMGFLEARQNAVSENISHADIPNYRACDVSNADFERLIEHGASAPAMLLPTSSKHMAGTLASAQGAFKFKDTPDREVSPTGNTVVLEDQMMKLSETQVSHQLAASIYRKAVDMLRIAIQRG